mmetsp:Transcript_18022/g.30705  ORF Transcript_18022/g.30705 Transcript_18022/m.30705 type:complete len:145 (+) Transcript_18022:389-823(+)
MVQYFLQTTVPKDYQVGGGHQNGSARTMTPSTPGSRNQNQLNLHLKEKYKWILMKYDMERDNRLAQAEQVYLDSQNKRPEEQISKSQYLEMKIRIEWDVAWRIFDHVNESNKTKEFVDLNCLDINEAQSITKQQIYDIAKFLYT